MFRYISFLISSILHLGLVLLVIFWPQSEYKPPVLPTGPVIEGIMTLGKPGGPAKQEKPAEPAGEQTKPKPVEKPLDTPDPLTPQNQPKPQDVAQQSKPEPVQKPAEKPLEKPVENSNAVKIPEKDTSKVKPTVNATAQKKPTKNATAKVKNPLEEALTEIKKETGASKPSDKTSGKPSGSGNTKVDINKELADLAKGLGGGGTTSGSGPGGEGGTGVGTLTDSYVKVVISHIQPNWAYIRADRKALAARVLLKIDPQGNVVDLTVIEPSGDPGFDGSVVQAIMNTKGIEPPPKSIPGGEIILRFTPQAISR